MDVLIWDKAPMANKTVLACAEESPRLIKQNNLPFGEGILHKPALYPEWKPVSYH
jgi:hypothetical protein